MEQHDYIIINKAASSKTMASSYNLRMRQKQQSPISKKTIINSPQSSSKQIPRTAHKPIIKTPSQSTGPSSTLYISSTVTNNNNDLLVNNAINHQISTFQWNSNFSQIESIIMPRISKQKLEQCEGFKHDDNASSLVLDEYGELKLGHSFKDVQKQLSEIGTSKYKKQKKISRKNLIGIPYRKFQTQLEEKVVCLINKIIQGKNCSKELERLLVKIVQPQKKDLKNRYLISGIAVILKLISNSELSFYPEELILKINQSYQVLLSKINTQINNISDFVQTQQSRPQSLFQSAKLISRVYKILRKKNRNQTRQKTQQKAIKLVNSYIDNENISNNGSQQGQLTTSDIKNIFQDLKDGSV